MTQTYSRPRQQAEIAFAKAQSQFHARDRAAVEDNSIARARQEKTLRLKNARLAREVAEHAKVTDPLLLKEAQRPDVQTHDTSNGTECEKQ